jgi:hypothetical protein
MFNGYEIACNELHTFEKPYRALTLRRFCLSWAAIVPIGELNAKRTAVKALK